MSNLYAQATEEISAKDTELNQARQQHAEFVTTSELAIVDLRRINKELDRELRWAKQNRDMAERQEKLARQELEALRDDSSVGALPLST